MGITEYLASKTKTKNFAMLIYNKKLSVCPLTTHLPIKKVHQKINKNIIKEKIKLIDIFFKKHLKKRAEIAITGLNPHCESIDIFDEDEKNAIPQTVELPESGRLPSLNNIFGIEDLPNLHGFLPIALFLGIIYYLLKELYLDQLAQM